MPDEFGTLSIAGTGTTYNGIDEWEVNLAVAKIVKTKLEDEGIVVDLLPATISQAYKADAFISIHADGNDDNTVTGFKVGASYYDTSGKAQTLADDIEKTYKATTAMRIDPNVTEDMTQYYVFNSVKYLHTIDPSTPGVIIETGFITNSSDRKIIVDSPEEVATGIVNGILLFLGK